MTSRRGFRSLSGRRPEEGGEQHLAWVCPLQPIVAKLDPSAQMLKTSTAVRNDACAVSSTTGPRMATECAGKVISS